MNTLVAYGSEIKTLEMANGRLRIGGYLVLFGSPEEHDATGQRNYFSREMDFDIPTSGGTFTVYYHHGLNPTLKSRPLGKARLELHDAGVWMEAELQARDEYEAKIQELIRLGKLGLSSGTASHLVERSERKNTHGETVHHIDRWPLGLDASLSPTPDEPRTRAVCLKALEELAGAEAANTLSETGQNYLFDYVGLQAALSGVVFVPVAGVWAVKEWDESKHPRDELGRWTDSGISGVARVHEALAPDESFSNNPYDSILPDEKNTHAEVHKELKVAMRFVNRQFDENSNWSGILEIRPKSRIGSAGSKPLDCRILLMAEGLPFVARRYSTILHEMLHSMEDYEDLAANYSRYRGWNEAVIEMVMRDLRADFLKELSVEISQQALDWRDDNHSYRNYINCLERLRRNLPPEKQDKSTFYYTLFATPLKQRANAVLEMAQGLDAVNKERFKRLLLASTAVLGPDDQRALKSMSKPDKLPTRDELFRIIHSAHTREEVIEARRKRNAYLKANPNDWGVFEYSEMLENLASILGLPVPDPELELDD